MTHRAETILVNLTTVVTGLTTTGSRVVRGRAWPVDTLPALTVSMGEDRVLDEQNYSVLNRVLTVFIVAHVRGVANLESTLNTIKTEIFAAIMADPTISSSAIDASLEVDGVPEIEAEQDQPTARLAMQWRVLYRHSATSTEV